MFGGVKGKQIAMFRVAPTGSQLVVIHGFSVRQAGRGPGMNDNTGSPSRCSWLDWLTQDEADAASQRFVQGSEPPVHSPGMKLPGTYEYRS